MHYQKMKYKYWHDKNVKNAKLNTKIVNAILNIQFANDNLVIFKCICYKRDYQKNLIKTQRNNLLKHTDFVTFISRSSFWCCKKVFTTTWMFKNILLNYCPKSKRVLQ